MKLKILHTNFLHGWGGQSNRILTKCIGLANKGHDVCISAPADSELIKRAKSANIDVFTKVQYQRGIHPINFFCEVLYLRNFIRNESFDIIHTHGSQDSWITSIAVSLINKNQRPILLRTKHNIFPIHDHFLNKIHYSIFKGMICISDSILQYCKEKNWLKNLKFSLIHSAVDYSLFENAKSSDIREKYNLTDNILIGVIARLRDEKGHIYLINAIPQIINNFPKVRFLFIGDGSLKESLMKRVKDLNVEQYVIFTGFRKDVPSILKSIDIFVLPSVSEGLGTAILEAGAAGTPILATNVGGIPDIIDDNETGFLVPPKNSELLKDKLIYLLNNPERLKITSEKLKQKIKSEFSPENLVSKTEQFYFELLKNK